MIVRSELKAKAKAQIKGNIGILFLCGLVIFGIFLVIGLVLGLIFAVTIGFSQLTSSAGTTSSLQGIVQFPMHFLICAFIISFAMIYLGLTHGKKPVVSDVFKGFTIYGKALWLYIITAFFTFLWALLLIIPGIIKAYSYSMATYVLAENPTMTARQALNESKKIMKGHKAELFVLHLSFILWGLLCIITVGIAAIYVVPYVASTTANFYNAVKQTPPTVTA